MSDNEDLLGDDLGDHSLADYNLGNEEEEQLLADDYETSSSQNVPTSVGSSYGNGDLVSADYSTHSLEYSAPQPMPYQRVAEAECVVPNITVEVPNVPLPDHSTYAPYEPENAVVPPAMPAAPLESPQIVPSDMPSTPNGDVNLPRERFRSERAPSSQRLPQVRDIPDSLDKVLIPRGGGGGGGGAWAGRGRTTWRNPQQQRGFGHPYRRHHRGNFNQRHSFPPQQQRPSPPQMRPEIRPNMRPDIRPDFRPDFRPEMHLDMRPDIRPDIRPDVHPDMRPDVRPEMRPDIRHEMRPDILPNMRPDIHPDTRPDIRPDMRLDTRPDMRPDIHPDMRPDIRPDIRPDMRHEQMPPQMGPEISPERPILPEMQFRPENRFGPNAIRPPNFRPNLDERAFGPRPMYQFPRPGFNPRPFGPPIREIAPNNVSHLPQVTIRQPLPGLPMPKMEKYGQPKPREQEVIMLPVQLPPNLPPGGLAGKKVLINPHFKGNFTPPVDGLPAYIPTRIQKSPPLSPTLESKFGPATDIDDAAERFIAEQRSALARAANRKPRREPQRYIENTTIEIENDMVGARDRDLLRRQEEFINANRAGLRRRMRSPSPARRSPSPRPAAPRPRDESSQDSEYRRRVREQESLRERVLRAKEVRRRKNAVALQKQLDDRERERQEKTKDQPKLEEKDKPTSTQDRPDTTRRSPDKPTPRAVDKDKMDKMSKVDKMDKVKELKVEPVRERSPVKEENVEVNSTCDNLTPPRAPVGGGGGGGTPPLPDSDDDLDLILGDIDGILSDDDDLSKQDRTEAKAEPTRAPADLRSKLPPKAESRRAPRQKIVFSKDRADREKTPPRRAVVTSSTKTENTENDKKHAKAKSKVDANTNQSRQRITFDYKESGKEDDKRTPFANRRVILQRKLTQTKDKSVFSRMDKTDPTQPGAGMFSRAVRTAISDTRILIKKQEEPRVDYDSESGDEPGAEPEAGVEARVTNLPPAITHARLASLAGDVQSLILDKEDRSAKITFKSAAAAEQFKRKFNNKMVAASRLTVALR